MFSRSYRQDDLLLTGSQQPGAQGHPGLLGGAQGPPSSPLQHFGASGCPSLPRLWLWRAVPTPGTPLPQEGPAPLPQHLPAAGAALASGTSGCSGAPAPDGAPCGQASCLGLPFLHQELQAWRLASQTRASQQMHARTEALLREKVGGGGMKKTAGAGSRLPSSLRTDLVCSPVRCCSRFRPQPSPAPDLSGSTAIPKENNKIVKNEFASRLRRNRF